MSLASFNLPFGVSDGLPWSMKASCVIDAISTLTSSPEAFISATSVHNVCRNYKDCSQPPSELRHGCLSGQPGTVYRWLTRFNSWDLISVESGSRPPHQTLWKQWSPAYEARILWLRRGYPRMGKQRSCTMADHEGVVLSPSTIGRILASGCVGTCSRSPTGFARVAGDIGHDRMRFDAPKSTPQPRRLGDLIQLDTMHLRSATWEECHQFTATDLVCRYVTFGIRGHTSAGTVRDFLADLVSSTPFLLRRYRSMAAQSLWSV